MPLFDRRKSLNASRMRKTQLTNRELQDEVAANCRLSRLPADIKIHILAFTSITTIRTLLQYLPLSATSFQRLFNERKRAILAAIVKEKLSWEWSMIAGNDPYVPFTPLEPEYFNPIALVVCVRFNDRRFEEMKRGTDNGWLRGGYDYPKTVQELRMRIYKAAKSNVFYLLRLLEEVQDAVKAREEITLSQWKSTFAVKEIESWIVPWGKKNLYRALLIEEKLRLPDTSMPREAIGAPNMDAGSQQNNLPCQAVRSRLTGEEWTILMDLMEARASHQNQKAEAHKPTKLSPAGEETWRDFLHRLEKAQSKLISSLGKGILALPSFLDISAEERAHLAEKFPSAQ
ncbi:hypothetical protein EMCG_02766 [[Emmonsia] crescens]|uniref:Uncharacterized protein n=1 Tax=[Emmonsia] crescens TaxID=73230 RepID=A0A0G2HYP0_9EURO|nr:hypothetical protein EMCG_02766 [Emmonsia crescens UAMH 3008]